VNAALSQFNVNENLTLKPKIEVLDDINKSNLSLKLVYTFNAQHVHFIFIELLSSSTSYIKLVIKKYFYNMFLNNFHK
jgi:hypothetical protein